MDQNPFIDAFAYYTTIRYTINGHGPYRSTHCRINVTVMDCMALLASGANILDVTVEREPDKPIVYTLSKFLEVAELMRIGNEENRL